jgi:lipoic acid synthetase
MEKSFRKTNKNPIKIHQPDFVLKKPDWVKIRINNSDNFSFTKSMLRKLNLHSVCEEASCPNIYECFGKRTATFMILGNLCTRRCPFCDVAHGRPKKADINEPKNLAIAVQKLNLKHVVITSVNRDDMIDGGATQFLNCINFIRDLSPQTLIEILVPDFRGRLENALKIISTNPPDVFNHNLETVPRLYKYARPGADYSHSLKLLKSVKNLMPKVFTKSGIMVGLGENDDEILEVIKDLDKNAIDLLTIGQYLSPSIGHLPVKRFVTPKQFNDYRSFAQNLNFKNVASGPLVRSSYHAEKQSLNIFKK